MDTVDKFRVEGGHVEHGATGITLSTDATERKATPICTGAIDYFPDAIAAVSRLSRKANDKHNPGEPMHWSKGKSNDHADCLVRHLVDRGKIDVEVNESHTVHVAWRALALLQTEIENAREQELRDVHLRYGVDS